MFQELFILRQYPKGKISFLLSFGHANFGRENVSKYIFKNAFFFSFINHKQVACKRIVATSFGLDIKPSSGH
jgi:hypothetical protein